MATFAFEIAAILIFWKLADFTRLKQLFPIVITTIFLRFLEHYLLIDWFKVLDIHGDKHAQLWLPMSANVTIWPIASYLFIQFMPKRRKILYGLGWVLIMLLYLQSLMWLGVFHMQKGWHIGYTAILQCVNFTLIYWICRWLSQGLTEQEKSKCSTISASTKP